MVELVRIERHERPSLFSNHIVLEDTQGGPIIVIGVCGSGGAPCLYAPLPFDSMQDALVAATTWAAKHDIETVHLIIEWRQWTVVSAASASPGSSKPQ